MLGNHFTDYSRPGSIFVSLHLSQDTGSVGGSNHGDYFALIGDIERVKPEEFTGSQHRFIHRDFIFFYSNPGIGLLGKVIEGGG
jgi:hypothetical protein